MVFDLRDPQTCSLSPELNQNLYYLLLLERPLERLLELLERLLDEVLLLLGLAFGLAFGFAFAFGLAVLDVVFFLLEKLFP